MTVVRLRLAPAGETTVLAGGTSRFPQTPSTGPLRGRDASRLPPRAPFFRVRLGPRAAQVAARAEEGESGNLPVSPAGGIPRMSPVAPSPAHRPKVGP
jgi:hypothetical protein